MFPWVVGENVTFLDFQFTGILRYQCAERREGKQNENGIYWIDLVLNSSGMVKPVFFVIPDQYY